MTRATKPWKYSFECHFTTLCCWFWLRFDTHDSSQFSPFRGHRIRIMSAYCKSHKQCASLLQITVAQKVESDSEDTANVGQAPLQGFVCLIADA